MFGGLVRSHVSGTIWRRSVVASSLSLFLVAALACSAGLAPAGAEDPLPPSDVTVPDDISNLDSEEVERRLGQLLNAGISGGQLAPEGRPTEVPVLPTQVPGEPTIEEILELLNSATPVPAMSEVVISISPRTLSGLVNPELSIKSPPAHGTATVIGPNQILYVPDGSGDGTDSFEYELMDGGEHVVSQVVEVKS